MAGMNDMLMILPAIFLMNQFDFTNETNATRLKIAYLCVQVLCSLAYVFIWFQVDAIADKKKIKVPKQPQMGSLPSPGETEEMTIQDYDKSQIKKAFSGIIIGVVIIMILNYKWNLVQPLFIQCFMGPMQLFKNPLVKIFLLGQRGEIEKRPFKEENPFAALMPQQPTEAEPENTTQSNSNTTTTQPNNISNQKRRKPRRENDDEPRVEELPDDADVSQFEQITKPQQVKG